MEGSSTTKKVSRGSTVLYIQKLRFGRGKDPDHVGVFVSENPATADGVMFHVIDVSDHDDMENGVTRLQYEELRDFHPRHAKSHKGTVRVGSMISSNMGRFRAICQRNPWVLSPDLRTVPNCESWVDNILHDLSRTDIVSFDASFRPPSSRQNLMPPLRKESGASSYRI